MAPFKVGLIGTGKISDIYLKNYVRFPELSMEVCGSLNPSESQQKAARFSVPRVAHPDEIISDPNIDCILNLTIPAAHAEVSLRALQAGKHVYSEKPFATNRADAQSILDLAQDKNLLIGNAPDTFLGGRWQTVRRMIDRGVIGEVTGCMVFVGTHGVERHHPNPDFYYKEGGGPLFDLGPYYLTVMVFLMGPIARVSGMARKTFDKRQIENGPRNGEWMTVEVDTHSLSILEFDTGAIGSTTISFDVWDSDTPRFEIYGTEGTICISDPDPIHGANDFHGPVWYRTRRESRWEYQPRPKDRPADWLVAENRHGFNENSRGLGLLDLALAVQDGRAPRTSGALSNHVLDVMLSILEAPLKGGFVDICSTCERPIPLPENFPKERK